jgi:hypothetical protein
MDMYRNPRKTKAALPLGPVDIGALREAVLQIPEELWNLEDSLKPNRFETLDRTRHIVFRFVKDLKDWRTDYERPLWAQWQPLLQPVLDAAVKPYGYARGVFPRVMLARMAPGGIIQPHRDNMPAALWPHKIHVPLLTNDKVGFYIEPKTYYFPVGEAVEVNNLDVHAVKNEGDSDRIHLIFEYYDPDQPSWLSAA